MIKHNTRSPVASSTIQLLLRGRGLHLLDARVQYAPLSISPHNAHKKTARRQPGGIDTNTFVDG